MGFEEDTQETSGFVPDEGQVSGFIPDDEQTITPIGLQSTGTTIKTNREAAIEKKISPTLISDITRSPLTDIIRKDIGIRDITEGTVGNIYKDLPTMFNNVTSDLFALPMYPIKNLIRADIGLATLFGYVKPEEFERMTQDAQETLGKIMNGLGYLSGVVADVINKPDSDIMKTIIDNWTEGRTLGDSLKEGLTKMGATNNETAAMIGEFGKSFTDLTTTIVGLKGAIGAPGEIKDNFIKSIAEGDAIRARTEINRLAKEADMQDAIKNTIKEKEFNVKKTIGDYDVVDAVRDMPTASYDNLFEIERIITDVKKEIEAVDIKSGVDSSLRQDFIASKNLFKIEPNELDVSAVTQKKPSRFETINGYINSIKKTYNEWPYKPLKSVASRFESLIEGKEMASDLRQIPLNELRHIGEYIGEIGNTKIGMFKFRDQKRLTNLQKSIQNKELPIDKINENLMNIIKRGYDAVWDKAANHYNMKIVRSDGTISLLKDSKMPNYDYRIPDWNESKVGGAYRDINIEKIMTKESVNKKTAEDMLDTMIENAQGAHGVSAVNGSLHFSREFDLEGYNNNPITSYMQYVQKSAKEFANIDIFGENGVKAYSMINKIAKANHLDYSAVEKMFDRGMGIYSASELKQMRITRYVKDYQNIKKLSLSGLGNIADLAQSARYGMVKGAIDIMRNFKGDKQFALDAGALSQSVMNRLQNMNTFMGDYFKVNQFNLTQTATEILGANSAKLHAVRMFKQYKKNVPTAEEQGLWGQHVLSNKKIFHETPANALRIAQAWDKMSKAITARKQLEEFKIDTSAALEKGGLSYEDLLNAGEIGGQFASSKLISAEAPMWSHHPLGQLGFQYKQWALAHAKNQLKVFNDARAEFKIMKDPRVFKPLIKLAAANGVMATTADILRKLITGKEITGEEYKDIKFWLEYGSLMTVGGLFTTTLMTLGYGGEAIFKAALGPAAGDIVDMGKAGGQLLFKGKVKPAIKTAIKSVPAPLTITTPIANKITEE